MEGGPELYIHGKGGSSPLEQVVSKNYYYCCPLHAMPPAMQCYGVVAGTRTHVAPDLSMWGRHVTRGVICVSSLLHAWRVPRPNSPCVGAIHVMRGMRGVWHVALGLLFPSAAGGAYWQIAIRCPSLPFPWVKVHQAAVLVRRFCFSMVAGHGGAGAGGGGGGVNLSIARWQSTGGGGVGMTPWCTGLGGLLGRGGRFLLVVGVLA